MSRNASGEYGKCFLSGGASPFCCKFSERSTIGADVLILCGGLGTRLGTAVSDRPKPMVEISGRPFLDSLIQSLIRQKFSRFILCSGYKSGFIKAYFRNYHGAEILVAEEREPLGTAGAVKYCEKLLQSDPVIVMNGDSICPSLNYGAFMERHQQCRALVTLAVTGAGERHDGGYITADESGRVLSFAEKAYQSDCYLSAGIYIFDRSVLDRIPAGVFSSLEKDIFPGLGKGFYVYPAEGKVYDIGTPERLEEFRRLGLTS